MMEFTDLEMCEMQTPDYCYDNCRMAMSEVLDNVINDITQEMHRIKAELLEEDEMPIGFDASFYWDKNGYALKSRWTTVPTSFYEEEAAAETSEFVTEMNWEWSDEDEESEVDSEEIEDLENMDWESVPTGEEPTTQGACDDIFTMLNGNTAFENYVFDLEIAVEEFLDAQDIEFGNWPPKRDDRIHAVITQAKKCKRIMATCRQIDTWMKQNNLFKVVRVIPVTCSREHLLVMWNKWEPGLGDFWFNNKGRTFKDLWFLASFCDHFLDIPVAQGNQNDLEESESISKFENVAFVDERPVESVPSHLDGDQVKTDTHVDISEVPWTMRQVLERETYLTTIEWATGQVGNLKTFAFPKDLIKEGSVIQNQLRLCGFFRAGVEIRLVMNGNKFMIGRAIVHTEPVRFKADANLNHIQSYPSYPHVFLDASVSNTAVLSLPFSSILSYFSQRSGALYDDSVNTIGRVSIDVFNQLQSPTGGTQAVSITVYARFINPSVHQTVYSIDKFAYSDGFVTQGLEDGNLIVNKSVQPPCFGDLSDNTVTLSLDRNGGKSTDPSIEQGIDATLKEAIQIPGLIYQGFWKVGEKPGNTLYSCPVGPGFVGPVNVKAIEQTGVILSPTYLNYISRCFAYWSGDIMIKIQIVGNAFASGRLIHVFDPTWVPLFGPVQDLDDLMNYNCVVQDVQEQQEIVIQIPFTSIRPYLRCDHWQFQQQFDTIKDDTKLSQSFMGIFRTLVLNQLVMPSQMTQSIEINFYMYAGPNFSLRIPTDLQPLFVDPGADSQRIPREPVYPVLYGQTEDPDFDNKNYIRLIWSEGLRLFKQEWLTDEAKWWLSKPIKGKGELDEVYIWCYKARQLIEYAEDVEESQQKLLVRSLGRFKKPLYGEPVTQGLEEFVSSRKSKDLVPILITKGNRANNAPEIENGSMAKLLHRYYPLMIGEPHLGLTGFTVYVLPVNPCYVPQVRAPIKGKLPPIHQNNQLAWISNMFAFWSGSLRYKIVFPNTDSDVYVVYVPQENMSYSVQSGASVQDVHALMAFAGDIAMTHLQGSIEVTVPFSSPYNQCMTNPRGGHYDARNQNGTLMIYVRNKLQAVNPFLSPISVFISAGSDFKLNWMVPPPEVFDNAVHLNCTEPRYYLNMSESHKYPGDYGKCIRTPYNSGFTAINKVSVIGYCEGSPDGPPRISGVPEPETQGLGDYNPFSLIYNINATARSLPEQVNVLNENVQKAQEALTQFSDKTGTMATKVSSFIDVAASTILASSVIKSFMNVCEKPEMGNFLQLGLSLAALLGYNVRRAIIDLTKEVLGLFGETEEQPQAQAMNGAMLDFVEDNENVITKSFAVLGTIVYAYVFDCMPDFSKFKDLIKSFLNAEPVTQGFDLRGAHFGYLGITALGKVFDNLIIYVKQFLDWAMSRDSPDALLARKAVEIQERVMNLIKDLDELDNDLEVLRAMADPYVHNRFYKLVEEANDLTDIFMKGQMDHRVGLLLTECRTRAKALVKRLEKESPTHGWRYDPFVVCLHGKTGTGKTALMREISQTIARVMSLSKFNRVYDKTINDAFWSGYTGQTIVNWDEFGQNALKDETVAEFVELRGNAPHRLNMAALEDKGRYFTSRAIVMTTNVPYHTFSTVIRDKDAYLRRRQVMIEMAHKPNSNVFVLQNTQQFDKEYSHCDFRITGATSRTNNAPIQTKNEILAFVEEKARAWDLKQQAMYDEYIMDHGLGVIQRGMVPFVEDVTALGEDLVEEFLGDNFVDAEGPVTEGLRDTVMQMNARQPKEQCRSERVYKISMIPTDENTECVYRKASMGSAYVMTYLPEHVLKESAKQWATRKSGEFWTYAKDVFAKLKESIMNIYTKYPKLIVAGAALGSITAVLASYFLIAEEKSKVEGPSCSWQEAEQGYDVHQAKLAKRFVKAEDQKYDGAQKAKGKGFVKAEDQTYNGAMPKKPKTFIKTEGNDDQASTDVRKVIHPNLVVVGWDQHAHKKTVLRGLHLCGQILLLPHHFFNGAQEGDFFILAHRLHPVMIEFIPSKMARLDDKDWCLYDCGARFEPRRSLMKYFISEKNLGKLNTVKVSLLNVEPTGTQTLQLGMAKTVLNYRYKDATQGNYYVQHGWETNLATESGDCGAVLMAMSNVLPAPGKVLGIHTAGYVKRNLGFSVLITREQVEQALTRLPPQVLGLPVPPEVDRDESNSQGMRISPEGDYSLYGTMPNKLSPSQPMKTNFVKTPFSEELLKDIPNPKKPAYLRPFTNSEGVKVSPLRLALQKYGKSTTPFSFRNIKKSKAFCVNLFRNVLKGTEKRVFSESEAINGIPGLDFADRLNMKSSPGWPYQCLDKQSPGKFALFDEEGKVINAELRKRIDERTENAKKGERVPSLWRDCLKDELRPNEKVEAGKSRLFTIAPVDYTIAVRRMFMDFAIAFYGNSCNFFSAVGINPESYEWTKLYNYLAKTGTKCVAGDYSTFDGTLMPEMIDAVADIINEWYDDGAENAMQRRVYINEMIHTMQLVENCVYATHQGNPSGNPLTVIVNTIVNFLYLCCVFLEIYPESSLEEFYEAVSVICYGDDVLFTVMEKFSKFHFNTVKDVLAVHGIGFTTDAKISENAPDFVELDSVTFLKRGFRVDTEFGKSFKLPTMAKDTLHSYFHWVRSSEEMEDQLRENMRSALTFAAFHGREFYESYHNKWEKCMREADLNPMCITFEEQVDNFLVSASAANQMGTDRQFFDNLTEGAIDFAGKPEVRKMDMFWAFLKGLGLGYLVYKGFQAVEFLARKNAEMMSLKDCERTSDRWAICLPSGEGKTTLARKHPDYFIDVDDFILFKGEMPGMDKYQKDKIRQCYGISANEAKDLPFARKVSLMMNTQKWYIEWVRTCDHVSEDRRILLTHHPINTLRQIAACFILPTPTNVRNNLHGRAYLEKEEGVQICDYDEREQKCLEIVAEKEPAIFAKTAQLVPIERTVGHFTSRLST